MNDRLARAVEHLRKAGRVAPRPPRNDPPIAVYGGGHAYLDPEESPAVRARPEAAPAFPGLCGEYVAKDATDEALAAIFKHADKLPGGEADGAPDSEVPAAEMAKGEKVEREHTDDPEIAREIVKDHHREFPHVSYYDALEKMEDTLERREEAAIEKEAVGLTVPELAAVTVTTQKRRPPRPRAIDRAAQVASVDDDFRRAQSFVAAIADNAGTKRADLLGDVPPPQPYQSRVARRVDDDGDRKMLVYHGLGSGKCVRGDTPIVTDCGVMCIEDIFPDDVEDSPESMAIGGELRVVADANGTPVWRNVRAVYRRAMEADEPTYVVETKRGNRLEARTEHRLKVIRNGLPEWAQVGDIRPGDLVAMARELPTLGDQEFVSDDLLHVLSWQITEGYERPESGVFSITQDDVGVLMGCQRCLANVLGTEVGSLNLICDKSMTFDAGSLAYRRKLESLGYRWGRISWQKRFPEWFNVLSDAQLRRSLRIVFDAEGSAGRLNVELTSASRALASQVQYALLRFGVRTSFHTKLGHATNGSGIDREYYRLSISGDDARRFRERVGFGFKYKSDALVAMTDKKSNPNCAVPFGDVYDRLLELGIVKVVGIARIRKETCSEETCRSVLQKLRWLLTEDAREHYRAAIRRFSSSIAGQHATRTLAVLVDRADDVRECADIIEAILALDYRYEFVESVTPGRRGGYVYDLEVDTEDDGERNYVAGIGGFLSHNSRSAIMAAEGAGGPYAAVVPASLRQNFEGEIGRWTDKKTPHEVMSYTGAALGHRPQVPYETLVLDEAHRVRNPGSAQAQAVEDMASRAKNLLLLSGTPIVNEPSDLAEPMTLLTGRRWTRQDFDRQFVGKQPVSRGLWGWLSGAKPATEPVAKNLPRLERELAGHVDYQPSREPEGVNVDSERIAVPLSREQDQFHQLMWGKLPFWTRWKLKNEYPLTPAELRSLHAFFVGPRQAGLSLMPFTAGHDPSKALDTSPKLQAALGNLHKVLDTNPRAKALVFSNFIDAGLGPYAHALDQDKVPYGRFDGGLSPDARRKALADYNAGRSRVLLLGPAGSEGISAKGTQLVQVLDPHFNEGRTRQSEARGLRFDSHVGLPEDLRNVRIERYISEPRAQGTLSRLLWGRPAPTADEVLERMAARKERLNDEFRASLRAVGSGQ